MGPWFKQRHYTALAVVSLVQTTSSRSRDLENQTGKGCQPQTADWRLSANLDADQYGPTYMSTQTADWRLSANLDADRRLALVSQP